MDAPLRFEIPVIETLQERESNERVRTKLRMATG